MPLNIIVVGAGIAGLSTAIALRQAGHTVKVCEVEKPSDLEAEASRLAHLILYKVE